MAVERIERLRGINGHLAFAAGQFPIIRLVAVLERAIAHQFRINPAIGGQVDVLKKDAPQRGGDGVPRFVNLHRQAGLGQDSVGRGDQGQNQQEEIGVGTVL